MTRSAPRRFFTPWVQIGLASLAGLGLRLYLVVRFPAEAGDSGIYEELAHNWIAEHVYGLSFASGLLPSDMRPPGYPAFLALLYLLFRRGGMVIVLAQAIMDLGTCFLIALLAWCLAAEPYRWRVALPALWLAVACPFVANYASVPLTEVLATFLTTAALLCVVYALAGLEGLGIAADPATIFLARTPVAVDIPAFRGSEKRFSWNSWTLLFLGGLCVGLGTLVRPETPLILAALALALGVRWRHRADWPKLVRAGILTGLGLLLPLLPWALRNWNQFHEVQFLAPRFAASPDEYTPRGLYAWTGTWLVRYRDVYLVPWNVDGGYINIGDIPPSAFDSPQERARVEALLDQYNATLRMTPEVDGGFATLARERTARHPWRTYLRVPLLRMGTLWFTPRVELLPLSGQLWPLAQRWKEDPGAYGVTLLLFALNFFYVGIAIIGVGRFARISRAAGGVGQRSSQTAIVFLVVFIVLRTAFLSTVETPEPRYVLECFPALLALGALAWLPNAANAASRLRGDFRVTPAVRDES